MLKISPGAYIFQRPFLRGLFLEGLIFGGAYLRREICVSKSIRLALQLEGNLPSLLCFTLYLRAISKYTPPGGGLYLEGLIHYAGAYSWNFAVSPCSVQSAPFFCVARFEPKEIQRALQLSSHFCQLMFLLYHPL